MPECGPTAPEFESCPWIVRSRGGESAKVLEASATHFVRGLWFRDGARGDAPTGFAAASRARRRSASSPAQENTAGGSTPEAVLRFPVAAFEEACQAASPAAGSGERFWACARYLLGTLRWNRARDIGIGRGLRSGRAAHGD